MAALHFRVDKARPPPGIGPPEWQRKNSTLTKEKRMTQTNSTECAVQEPENNVKQQGSNVVDLLSLSENGATSQTLELIKIGEDESLLIPFTAERRNRRPLLRGERDQRIRRCNGDDCVLCRIGKKQEPRLLLPVYVPMERLVRVLPLSRSFRPGALLPQILNVLKAEDPIRCDCQTPENAVRGRTRILARRR